ncbi:hypothetical protein BDV38DRAFT_190111 [Aspergillus pseudotamarii]|uniref:Uncharacterized protein n=1 Tax=Aspergillus pseudotamarii TaxID=132259 RepID=A0A5N6T5M7_ASPPS|nr:uncharacterized protein BDV38DRAFT_190111 [Aspergillus pseudotamarii]KAE8141602.1 hypothetical protein BDV38DRAFT_190111 [Aspergillus pseudotamarii]
MTHWQYLQLPSHNPSYQSSVRQNQRTTAPPHSFKIKIQYKERKNNKETRNQQRTHNNPSSGTNLRNNPLIQSPSILTTQAVNNLEISIT